MRKILKVHFQRIFSLFVLCVLCVAMLLGGQMTAPVAYADTAIGPQRRPAGPYPPAIHIGIDGIGLEIELHIGILLAHHIHMGLQSHRRPVLKPCRSRFAHHNVADGIALAFQSVTAGEIDQILSDSGLFFRRTRDFRYGIELFPYHMGFEVGYFGHDDNILCYSQR